MDKVSKNLMAKASKKSNLVLKKYHYHNGVKVWDLPQEPPRYLVKHVFKLHFDNVAGRFTQKLDRIEPPIGVGVTSYDNVSYIVGIHGNLLKV